MKFVIIIYLINVLSFLQKCNSEVQNDCPCVAISLCNLDGRDEKSILSDLKCADSDYVKCCVNNFTTQHPLIGYISDSVTDNSG